MSDKENDSSDIDASGGVQSEDQKVTLLKQIQELYKENRIIRGKLVVTDPSIIVHLRQEVVEKQQRVKELLEELTLALSSYLEAPDYASLKFKYQLFVDETKKFAQENKIDESLWKDLKY